MIQWLTRKDIWLLCTTMNQYVLNKSANWMIQQLTQWLNPLMKANLEWEQSQSPYWRTEVHKTGHFKGPPRMKDFASIILCTSLIVQWCLLYWLMKITQCAFQVTKGISKELENKELGWALPNGTQWVTCLVPEWISVFWTNHFNQWFTDSFITHKITCC